MSLHMNYHQIDRSQALEQFIKDKLEGMKKYLGEGSRVNWVFSKDGDLFESHVHIHSRGKDNFVESAGKNAYESVMQAFRKIKSVSLKDASKIKRSIGGKNRREMKASLLAG
jgi:ribosome-associated translation inhibitor RaiA